MAIGALIGLIPGCAVQTVFTGLYVSGGVPLPTLVADAVSQDGDALIRSRRYDPARRYWPA